MSGTDRSKNIYSQCGLDHDRNVTNDNFRAGDVVTVIDPGTVRRQWNVGCIEETYSGPEGLVGVVDVRVNDKTLKRAITKISPREIRDTEA